MAIEEKIKTYRQIEEEEGNQLTESIYQKINSIPEELTKIADNFKDKQSEIRLRSDAGLGDDYEFLNLVGLPNQAIIMDSRSWGLHRGFVAKEGIIPNKKYKSLWGILEANNIWQLESILLPIMDADKYSVFLSKDGKRKEFNFNGLISPILTSGCFQFEEIDETTAKSFEKYFNIITEIRKLSKYAKKDVEFSGLKLDIYNTNKELKEKKTELRQHPRFFADLYRYKGKLDRSIEYYKKSIEYDPKDYDAQYWLAMLYERTGKKDKALEQLQKFIQITEGVKKQKVWSTIAENQIKILESR